MYMLRFPPNSIKINPMPYPIAIRRPLPVIIKK